MLPWITRLGWVLSLDHRKMLVGFIYLFTFRLKKKKRKIQQPCRSKNKCHRGLLSFTKRKLFRDEGRHGNDCGHLCSWTLSMWWLTGMDRARGVASRKGDRHGWWSKATTPLAIKWSSSMSFAWSYIDELSFL